MPYSTSFSSRFFLTSNVVGVATAQGKFVYNFFQADERVSEEGLAGVRSERYSQSLTQEDLFDPNFVQEVPRYVQLDFNYFGFRPDFEAAVIGNEELDDSAIHRAFRNGNIIAEESLGAYDFSSGLYGNKQLEESCDSFFRKFFTKTGLVGSPAELLKVVSRNTNITADVLSDMLPESLGNMAFNNLKYATSEKFKKEEDIVDQVMLNATYAPYMLYGPQCSGNMLYNMAGIGRLQESIQGQIQNLNAFWSLDENVFNIPYTSVEKLDNPPALSYDKMECIGFIFEKTRIFDGQKYPMKSVIVSNPRARTVIDTEIAADMVYEYKPRAVYHVKIPMKASGQYQGWFSIEFFVASEVTSTITVVCEEDRRPLPPATIDFSYSLEADRLRIDWRDIVNDQRDIKYFQVFRRQYIEQPFELIGELDFDDSIVRKDSDESIDPDLIVDLDFRVNFFEDTGFDHDSKFIYAIVTKDARMNSSVYSAQYAVSYDLNTKTTIVEQVSDMGAPKHMPNYKLSDSDMNVLPRFPASLKNSGHSSARIIFDPECLAYVTDKGNQSVTTRLFDPVPSEVPINSISQEELDTVPHSRFSFHFMNVDKIQADSLEVYVSGDPIEEGSEPRTVLNSPFANQRLSAQLDAIANGAIWETAKLLRDRVHAFRSRLDLYQAVTNLRTSFNFAMSGYDPVFNYEQDLLANTEAIGFVTNNVESLSAGRAMRDAIRAGHNLLDLNLGIGGQTEE